MIGAKNLKKGLDKRIHNIVLYIQLYKVAQVLGCHIEDIIEPELAEAEESGRE